MSHTVMPWNVSLSPPEGLVLSLVITSSKTYFLVLLVSLCHVVGLDTCNKLVSNNDCSRSLMKSKGGNMCRGASHIAAVLTAQWARWLLLSGTRLIFLRQINHGCTRSKCHRNEPPFHIPHIFMGWRWDMHGGAREKASSGLGNQS